MHFFDRLKARQPGTPLYRILWWQAYHAITFVWFVTCYRFRAYGARHVPDAGPVLLLSNHQSYLDPIIVGLGASKRQFRPLARKTLWDSAVFRALELPFNSIPVDQESTGDLRAMKACIAALKEQHAVLVFPEGGRTPDGHVQPFQSGVMLLVKRARPLVVPVAVAGAFDAWPIGAKRPKLLGRIGCMYGKPIPAEELLALHGHDALRLLEHRVESLRVDLAERLGKSF